VNVTWTNPWGPPGCRGTLAVYVPGGLSVIPPFNTSEPAVSNRWYVY
jgi:hypothetical protein